MGSGIDSCWGVGGSFLTPLPDNSPLLELPNGGVADFRSSGFELAESFLSAASFASRAAKF